VGPPRSDLRRDEGGFTIIELLVSMSVLLLVLFATLQLLDSSSVMARQETDRAHAVREAQVGLDRMVRELRHAQTVTGTATTFTATLVRQGVTRTVSFTCDAPHPTQPTTRRCLRTEGTVTSELIDQVQPRAGDPPIFTYTAAASGAVRHVGIRLPIRLDGGDSTGYGNARTILRDGTGLRNRA
jgi:type II secretory pathway pseudopilin PulG